MHTIDLDNLQAFGNVAAGHKGVLSDADGSIVIKPCTDKEVKFYTQVTASMPELVIHIPTFMGTLELADEKAESSTSSPTVPSTATSAADTDAGPLFGKRLTTSMSIVLENVAAGFEKPNILDIKLGARLWDDEARPEKRARLDAVATETTSSSLGFRIAGMRVWNGGIDYNLDSTEHKSKPGSEHITFDSETGYRLYNKMYGRVLNADNFVDSITEYLTGPSVSTEYAREVLDQIKNVVEDIGDALESVETRMYSASLLIVFEGDPVAAAAAMVDRQVAAADAARVREQDRQKRQVARAAAAEAGVVDAEDDEDDDEDDDDDDDEFDDGDLTRLVARVKLIDFAHATIVTGQGPDQNSLTGVKNAVVELEKARSQI